MGYMDALTKTSGAIRAHRVAFLTAGAHVLVVVRTIDTGLGNTPETQTLVR